MKRSSALYTAAMVLAAGAVGCVATENAYGQSEQQQIPWSQSIGFNNGAYSVSQLQTTLDLPGSSCALQTGDYQQLYISSSNGSEGFAIGWYFTGTTIQAYTWTTAAGGTYYQALNPGTKLTVAVTLDNAGNITGSFDGQTSGATTNVGTAGVVGQEDVGEYPGINPMWVTVGFTNLTYNNGTSLEPGTKYVYSGQSPYTCNSFSVD